MPIVAPASNAHCLNGGQSSNRGYTSPGGLVIAPQKVISVKGAMRNVRAHCRNGTVYGNCEICTTEMMSTAPLVTMDWFELPITVVSKQRKQDARTQAINAKTHGPANAWAAPRLHYSVSMVFRTLLGHAAPECPGWVVKSSREFASSPMRTTRDSSAAVRTSTVALTGRPRPVLKRRSGSPHVFRKGSGMGRTQVARSFKTRQRKAPHSRV